MVEAHEPMGVLCEIGLFSNGDKPNAWDGPACKGCHAIVNTAPCYVQKIEPISAVQIKIEFALKQHRGKISELTYKLRELENRMASIEFPPMLNYNPEITSRELDL